MSTPNPLRSSQRTAIARNQTFRKRLHTGLHHKFKELEERCGAKIFSLVLRENSQLYVYTTEHSSDWPPKPLDFDKLCTSSYPRPKIFTSVDVTLPRHRNLSQKATAQLDSDGFEGDILNHSRQAYDGEGEEGFSFPIKILEEDVLGGNGHTSQHKPESSSPVFEPLRWPSGTLFTTREGQL
ncbi:hypothetical protein TWF970_010764 [Orbilia oligospora]|uniref:Uncharacterized protein n=1 Tax=Orbilia oligospora TaxID=2813651 RepID=A0A7C8V4L1_ORBOL|nr:hypothetical protein TWF970_010764 [Orbilia oligospora]